MRLTLGVFASLLPLLLSLLLPPAASAQIAIRSIPITATGAKCDDVTDDTAALNRLLDGSFPHGMTVTFAENQFCLVNSGNLVISAGMKLIGNAGPIVPAIPGALQGSGFLINPAYKVQIAGNGVTMQDLALERAGLTVNPSTAQALAAVAAWSTDGSVGLEIEPNVAGTQLDRLFVEGFDEPFRTYSSDFSLSHIFVDGWAGFHFIGNGGGDQWTAQDLRAEPFYSLKTPNTSGAWARGGPAFWLDNFPGGNLSNVFGFMHAYCVLGNDTGGNINDSGCEWQSTYGNGLTDAMGLRLTGHASQFSLNGAYFNGFDLPISVEASGGVTLHQPNLLTDTIAGIEVAGGFNGTPTTITVSGTPAAGDTAQMVLAGSFTGSPQTVSYTAQSGDLAADVARGLERAILLNRTLGAGQWSATLSGAVVTVQDPAGQAQTVTPSSTGGISLASGTGTATAHPWGTIAGAYFSNMAAGKPFITWGNSSDPPLQWIISDPQLSNGSGPIPTGWLSVPKTNGALGLVGVKWSTVTSAVLSGCGTSPTVAAGSNDGDGVVTEGGTATGCTLTFATPFYEAPTCTLSSPTGSTPTSYSATTTALAIVNASASGDQFAWHCRPQ